MHMRHLILSATVLISACSGGGGSTSDANSSPVVGSDSFAVGNLSQPTISGLRYSTATQGGFTDATGTFRFREGETIHFWLGEQPVASGTARADLSLASLLGSELPLTPEALLAQTNNRYALDHFDRLVNVVHLLLRLDQGDLDDAYVRLPLDLYVRDDVMPALLGPMHEMTEDAATSQLIREHGNTASIDYIDAIEWLYQTANITIASERTEQVRVVDSDGKVTITDYAYNDMNQVHQTQRYLESNPAGASETTYSWYTNGRLKQVSTGAAITDFSYTASGQPDEIVQSDGVTTASDTFTYDAQGNLLQRRTDTSLISFEERYTYSAAPDRVEMQLFELGDTSERLLQTESSLLNSWGAPLAVQLDADGDGTIDTTTDFTYDDYRRVLQQQNATAIADYTYNMLGLLAERSQLSPRTGQTLLTTTYEYDSEGRVTARSTQYFDASMRVIGENSTLYSYSGTLLNDGIANLLQRPEDTLTMDF